MVESLTRDKGSEVFKQGLVMANDIRSRELLALAKKVASTNVTVFINGPTGTGKEIISNYVKNKYFS